MGISVRERIMDEMLRSARTLKFVPCDQDDAAPLPPENIILGRFKATGKANQKVDEDEWVPKPGLVLTCPKIDIPPQAGTNNKDDWFYQWLWQIVDDGGNDAEANMRTYWRWQEQLASYFNQSQLNQQIDDERGNVYIVTAQTVFDADEKTWPVTRFFICGVICVVACRQPRGVV